MRIVEITAQENGAHRNQEGVFVSIPEGWAVIPFNMAVPDTFPFVDIEVEDGIVVKMTAGIVPEVEPVEPEPIEPEPTVWDELDAAYQKGVNTAYDE